MNPRRVASLTFATVVALAAQIQGQVIDLTVHDIGLAIGDKARITGVRVNFRDRELREVTGANITIWLPYDPAKGVVRGFALGLPATGARRITGVATGVLGVGVEEGITGIAAAPIGLGAGRELRGIMVGGVGVGSGGLVSGIAIGGVGVGGGGTIEGLMIGGIGVASGSSIRGISIGGIGVGAGAGITGLSIGGIGVGSAGDVRGITIGGIGVGAGGDVIGLSIGGVGVGSGGTVRGVTIGGIGVGAPRVEGLALSAFSVGGGDIHAIVLAPGYFKVERGGTFEGASVFSAYNRVLGRQTGLTIGVVNYARELHGVQIGLINVSDNDGVRRFLPLVSVR
jgi:hypothetical protein